MGTLQSPLGARKGRTDVKQNMQTVGFGQPGLDQALRILLYYSENFKKALLEANLPTASVQNNSSIQVRQSRQL